MPSNKGTKWKTAGAKGELDIFNLYKQTADNQVDKKKFKEVLVALNEEFIRMVVMDGKEVRMPYLNMLSIRKSKNSKGNHFDYGHFNKTGEKRIFDNKHSDGYSAYFHWKKSQCRIPGKSVYSFEVARSNSRLLAQEMKVTGGHIKYVEYYGK